MEVTLRVTGVNAVRRPGRITVRADDPSLTPFAGLAVSGELARRLGLAALIDAELAVERRARPVKLRRRGRSAGELVVALAECQLVGGSFFDHVEDVRADSAGAGLRAVAATPSAPAALQNASASAAAMCSASSARRPGPPSVLTGRWAATSASR
jgi:hypothetical protein